MRRLAFTLVELLVVIAIIAMLVGILLPAVQAARSAARRSACGNHMRQLGIAIAGYQSQFEHFPPGSQVPLRGIGLSWRVHLLPWLEEVAIYEEIGVQAGPSGDNWKPAREQLPVFQCPAHSSPQRNRANYAGIMGAGREGQVFVTEDTSACGAYFQDGTLYPDSQVTAAHIKDGLSQTLIVGERVYSTRDSWMMGSFWSGSPKTKSCVYAAKNVSWPLNSEGRVGYFVADNDAPPEQRTILMNDLMFGSDHGQGAFFLAADGSVSFVSDSVTLDILQDRVTIAGSEVIASP